jgi:integrase
VANLARLESARGLDTTDYLRIWKTSAATTRLAASSVDQYSYWVLRFLAHACTPVPLITSSQVSAFLSPMHAKTANTARSALLHFFAVLERRGLVDSPIDEPVRRIGQDEVIAFTRDELVRVLVAASWGWEPLRGLLFLAQYSVGARDGEFTALAVSDVHLDVEDPHLIFRHTKGRKIRRVPLEGLSLRTFQALDLRRGLVCPVKRGSYWKWFRDACELAEVPRQKAHPHTLRRTFITDMLRAGVKMEVVARLVGHENIHTTDRYYRWVCDQERRDALRLL